MALATWQYHGNNIHCLGILFKKEFHLKLKFRFIFIILGAVDSSCMDLKLEQSNIQVCANRLVTVAYNTFMGDYLNIQHIPISYLAFSKSHFCVQLDH